MRSVAITLAPAARRRLRRHLPDHAEPDQRDEVARLIFVSRTPDLETPAMWKSDAPARSTYGATFQAAEASATR